MDLFGFFLQAIEPRRDMSVLMEQHAEDELRDMPASLPMPKQAKLPALQLAAIAQFNHDC